MSAFQNKLNDLEARLKAENEERGKAPDAPDFTTGSSGPRRPKPLGDFNFAKRPPKGLSLGTGLPGEPGSGVQRRRHFHLPCSPQPQKPPDSHEIEQKYQEIMKASGILTLDGSRINTHIDDLETLGELGHGTCGHVVKMRHKKTGHLMAVKQMRRSGNREENKRIIMDLDVVLKSHDCPYIVQCLGTFITTSDVWICMELMATCLDKLLKRLKAPVPEPILGKVAVATVNALNYLKDEHGVIHRDVKPSNILIDEHGRIKLCDFGISGRLVDSKAKTRSAGCAAYMAPERIDPPDPTKPDYDIRADVWSLGISLVELALGEFPYKNCKTDFEVLTKVLEEEPPRLPGGQGFTMHFCMFVTSCLTKDYRRRPKYRKLLEHPYIQKYEKCFVNVAAWYANVMGIERPKAQIQQPPSYFARSESYAGPTGPSPLVTPLTTPSLTTPSVDYCLTQPMFSHGTSPSCSDGGWPSPQSSTSSRVDFSLGYSPSPSPSPSPSGPFHTNTTELSMVMSDSQSVGAQSFAGAQSIGAPSMTRSADLGQSRSPNYNQIRMFDPNQGSNVDYRSTKSSPGIINQSRGGAPSFNSTSSQGNGDYNHGRATVFNNSYKFSSTTSDFDQHHHFNNKAASRSFTQPDFADFRNMETRSESGKDYLQAHQQAAASQNNGALAHAARPMEFGVGGGGSATTHHQHQPHGQHHHHQRGLSLDLGAMRHNHRSNNSGMGSAVSANAFMMPKDSSSSSSSMQRPSFSGHRKQTHNNGLAMSIPSHGSGNPFTNMVSSSYPNNSTPPANKGTANPFLGNPFKARNANPFCEF